MHRFCQLKIAVGLILVLLAACSTQSTKAPENDADLQETERQSTTKVSPLPDIDHKVNLKTLWRDQVGKGSGSDYLRLTPKVVGSSLFAVSYEGLVERRVLESGDTLWSQQLDVEITGAPGFADGAVLIGTGTGELVKLKAADGALLWRIPVSSEVLSEPISNGKMIVVQTVDGKVTGHLFDTGERLWVYDSNLPVLSLRGTASPLIIGRSAILGFANGKLVSLNLETGSVIWEQRLGIPTGRSELERLVDIDGKLYRSGNALLALGYNSRLAALDYRSGRILWDLEASGYSGPVNGLGRFYITMGKGLISAYDDTSLARQWSQSGLAGRKLSASALLGDYLAVGDYEGYIHLIAASTGELVGRERLKRDSRQQAQALLYDYRFPSRQYRRDDGIIADVIATDEHLVAFNKEGRIAVFSLSEAK